MSNRKYKILRETIKNYIETAEPVSSNVVLNKMKLDVSASTIRQELNALEKEGFLTHIHTSSGRVPTDKGYRHYVDTLLPKSVNKDLNKPSQAVLEVDKGIEKILQNVSHTISTLMGYSTIALTPDLYEDALKVVHLILVDIDRILVVLLNDIGENTELFIHNQDNMSQEDLNQLSNWLTQKLKGKPVGALTEDVIEGIKSELPHLNRIAEVLHQKISERKKKDRYLLRSGISNLIQFPEFKNLELIQNVVRSFEENKIMLRILQQFCDLDTSKVIIGEEHEVPDLEPCSLVITPYKIKGKNSGVIGTLGPKRMNYDKIIPLMERMTTQIEAQMSENRVTIH